MRHQVENISRTFQETYDFLQWVQKVTSVDCSSRSEAWSAERSEFIISSREAHAQCVNRAWVLASCKVADFIFICIYPMVSAMTSYSSWRHGAFLFLGNIRLKAISNSHQWPKHSWRAVFSSSAKQCLLSVNLKLFLMQTEQQTQERRIVNPRRGRYDTEKFSGHMCEHRGNKTRFARRRTCTLSS